MDIAFTPTERRLSLSVKNGSEMRFDGFSEGNLYIANGLLINTFKNACGNLSNGEIRKITCENSPNPVAFLDGNYIVKSLEDSGKVYYKIPENEYIGDVI